MSGSATLASVPRFEVGLDAPDISDWRVGNTGIRGFTRAEGTAPGLHVVILALSHGNEIAGAIVLNKLLQAGVKPKRGRLTLGFVNLDAFDRFDPSHPTFSRFVDEDINRVWDIATLESPRRSVELDRAREIRPLIDTADVVLDLHSMLWPSEPLILCGQTEKGRKLACAIGAPELIVADQGHVGGRRLIDYARFSDPGTPFVANLVEAGQHWQEETVSMMLHSVSGLLHQCCGLAQNPILPPPKRPANPRCAEVTVTVTAATHAFAFVQPWKGGDIVPQRNTLIAVDGPNEIRTPYDDCLLVMPSLRPSRGHTAVRLARFV
jgi:predicted deacylase